MKQRRLLTLLLVLLLSISLLTVTASAAETVASGTCGDDLIWILDDTGTLTISGTGEMYNYLYYLNPDPDEPAPWTAYCDEVTTVVVSDGVTTIGTSAFEDMTALTSISLPDSVTSIGDCAFFDCTSLLSIQLPSQITKIPHMGFCGCLNLQSITIPSSVTSISIDAFYCGPNLTSITFLGSAPSVMDDEMYSFSGSLTGYYPQDDASWTDIVTQNSWGGATFTWIPYEPHTEHTPQATAAVEATCSQHGSTAGSICAICHADLIIPQYIPTTPHTPEVLSAQEPTCTSTGLTEGSRCAVCLETLTAQESVPTVDHTPADVAEIPATCLSSGTSAGTSCSVCGMWLSGQEPIDPIPHTRIDGVCTVCGGIDGGSCDSISWILLPNGTLTITGTGGMPFFDEYTPAPWTVYGDQITAVVISEGITTIGYFSFANCSALTSVTLPDSLQAILINAFKDCPNLTSIILPDSISYLAPGAFVNCTGLQRITIPSRVAALDGTIFDGCTNLKYVTFLGSAPVNEWPCFTGSITGYYPQGDASWTEIVATSSWAGGTFTWVPYEPHTNHVPVGIPAKAATCQQTGLTEGSECSICHTVLTVQTVIPTTAHSYDNGACTVCGSTEVLGSGTCGEDLTWRLDGSGTLTISGSGPMDTAPWGEQKDLIRTLVLSYGVTTICDTAFQDCAALTSVTLGSGISSIGDAAFQNCTALVSVTTADLPTPDDARYSVRSMTRAISGATIGKNAFAGCTSLTSITIPSAIATIETAAFSGCTQLTNVTIPPQVTTIEPQAFDACEKLSNVTFQGSAPTMAEAFTTPVTVSYPAYDDSWTEVAAAPGTDLTFKPYGQHLHTEETVTGQAAACTTAGLSDGAQCATCGQILTAQKYIAPLGHDLVRHQAKAPTCTAVGWDAYTTCSRCDYTTYAEKAALGHTPEAVPGKAATCTAAGLTDGAQCAVCDTVLTAQQEIPATGHNYQKGTCTVCGAQEPGQQPPITFSDVQSGRFYYNAVNWAVANQVTTGYPDGTFRPEANCTRGQVVTFLYRAAGSPAVSGNNPFTDVQPGNFYYKAVLWAAENGITSGVTKTTFCPDQTVTREQFVTFLYRYAGKPAVSGDSGFTDVDPHSFYAKAVAWAAQTNVTQGMTKTEFGVGTPCQRGHVVTFLYRYFA